MWIPSWKCRTRFHPPPQKKKKEKILNVKRPDHYCIGTNVYHNIFKQYTIDSFVLFYTKTQTMIMHLIKKKCNPFFKIIFHDHFFQWKDWFCFLSQTKEQGSTQHANLFFPFIFISAQINNFIRIQNMEFEEANFFFFYPLNSKLLQIRFTFYNCIVLLALRLI